MVSCKTRFGVLVVAMTALLTACSNVKNVSYLQDIQPGVPILAQEVRQLTLQPGDRLRITVFSRDRELTELFNVYYPSTGGNTIHIRSGRTGPLRFRLWAPSAFKG